MQNEFIQKIDQTKYDVVLRHTQIEFLLNLLEVRNASKEVREIREILQNSKEHKQ